MGTPRTDDLTYEGSPIPDHLLKKLWSAYAVADDRRRRTFFYLLSAVAVFGLLWVTKEDTVELPLIGAEVRIVVALALSPAFVAVLTARYLCLCAHSMLSYVTYIGHYYRAHEEELEKAGYSLVRLHASLKLRDMTENLNPFMIPRRLSTEWNVNISKTLLRVVRFLHSIASIGTVLIPILAYASVVVWLVVHAREFLPLAGAIFLISFYTFLGVVLCSAVPYFYQRAKPARDELKEWGIL